MTQAERIYEELELMDSDDLTLIVQNISAYSGALEDQVWDSFDCAILADWLTSGTVERLNYLIYSARTGDLNEEHAYMRIDDYGYPVSTDHPTYDLDDISEYIAANAEDLDCWGLPLDLRDTIQVALEDYADDADEDEDEDEDELTRDEVIAVLVDYAREETGFRTREDPTAAHWASAAAACFEFRVLRDPADVIDAARAQNLLAQLNYA